MGHLAFVVPSLMTARYYQVILLLRFIHCRQISFHQLVVELCLQTTEMVDFRKDFLHLALEGPDRKVSLLVEHFQKVLLTQALVVGLELELKLHQRD